MAPDREPTPSLQALLNDNKEYISLLEETNKKLKSGQKGSDTWVGADHWMAHHRNCISLLPQQSVHVERD